MDSKTKKDGIDGAAFAEALYIRSLIRRYPVTIARSKVKCATVLSWAPGKGGETQFTCIVRDGESSCQVYAFSGDDLFRLIEDCDFDESESALKDIPFSACETVFGWGAATVLAVFGRAFSDHLEDGREVGMEVSHG